MIHTYLPGNNSYAHSYSHAKLVKWDGSTQARVAIFELLITGLPHTFLKLSDEGVSGFLKIHLVDTVKFTGLGHYVAFFYRHDGKVLVGHDLSGPLKSEFWQEVDESVLADLENEQVGF